MRGNARCCRIARRVPPTRSCTQAAFDVPSRVVDFKMSSPASLARFMRDYVLLYVNGKRFEIRGERAFLSLTDFLRDVLHLTGTKVVCAEGDCGACTVLVDGHPIRSCVTPAATLVGKSITTIEGLSSDVSHPVQRAWLEEDVPQCGYCQSGQILTAVSLLARTAQPTDADIDEALNGNICRCGTYNQIRAAVHRAANLQRQVTEDTITHKQSGEFV